MGGYSMRPRANINLTEDAVTEAIVEYCNLRGIPIAHVPNEGKRSLQYGVRLKKMGMQKGFPDLIIPLPKGKYHGLYIEVKVGNNTTTADQKKWLTILHGNGYAATACWGIDEGMAVVNRYLRGEEIPMRLKKSDPKEVNPKNG